ncbi:hypothetical protein TrST_g1407 [Triparma strigata]|uniref:Vacuolar protein-sorting-associated protein 36 n=1 Tax=Triparma strigata TaxID=1606541 RepID=A0A9W7EAB9_9STRA|nr:hypothetical protein TrST_g1407 [Triparma strigata]
MAYLTSHFLVFTTGSDTLKSIPLKSIVYEGKESVEAYTSFMGRNPKVKFHVRKSDPVAIVKSGQHTSTSFLDVIDGVIVVKSDLQKTILEKLTQALERKEWKNDDSETSKKRPDEGFKASGAGIGGIIRRKKEKQSVASKQIDEAFDGDLESLMRNAKNVITLATKCKAKLSREDGGGEVDELSKMLEGMGIVGGVTKDSAGDNYTSQLAREINDWLIPTLHNKSKTSSTPIINVTDVYVMYNRARGVDFISPKDLIMGLEHAEKMFKGFKRKDFMGVKCVVGKQFREDIVASKILNWVEESGKTVDFLSKNLGVNEVMGKCIVEEVEGGGKLVRDEGVEGTKFFKNEFDRFFEQAGIKA